MVNKTSLMKYEVSFPAHVRVILNDDLTVISHEIDYEPEATTTCQDIDTGELITDGDYDDIVGNAIVYSLGLHLVSGNNKPEDNGEPF